MAFIVLTRRNVAALKSRLRKSYPQIGSGHADEAIAAGIGVNTHAALLATLAAQGNAKITILLSEEAVRRRLKEIAELDLDIETATWRNLWEPFPDSHDLFRIEMPQPANRN